MVVSFFIKMKTINEIVGPILASLTVFFAPLVPLLLAVGSVIALDTITGIGKAVKQKEKITSRKFGQVVAKMLIYQLTIGVMFLLDIFILGGFVSAFVSVEFAITKIVALVLILVELKSINENIEVILNVNIVKFFREFLKDIRDDIKTLKDIDNLKKK